MFFGNHFRGGERFIRMARSDYDVCAHAGERIGHLKTETFGAAGNPRDLPGQFEEINTHWGVATLRHERRRWKEFFALKLFETTRERASFKKHLRTSPLIRSGFFGK